MYFRGCGSTQSVDRYLWEYLVLAMLAALAITLAVLAIALVMLTVKQYTRSLLSTVG
jgi:hypothetical protein